MNNELRVQFDEAIRLKEAGDFSSAREILAQLHELDSSSASVLAVLADVCWELQQHGEAISFFQEAIMLKPQSEALSLGLFHCLWESGREDDAFDEMRRFVLDNESEEYRRLLADIEGEVP